MQRQTDESHFFTILAVNRNVNEFAKFTLMSSVPRKFSENSDYSLIQILTFDQAFLEKG